MPAATHGMYESPEYRVWITMKARCLNPKRSNYKNYGGRGITVCPRWVQSFESFYADMGAKPSPSHTLDRIDNDKNYEPENCRWSTPKEQQNNRRNTIWVVYRGRTMSLEDARIIAGEVVTKNIARLRVARLGWDVTEAIETPRMNVEWRRKANR